MHWPRIAVIGLLLVVFSDAIITTPSQLHSRENSKVSLLQGQNYTASVPSAIAHAANLPKSLAQVSFSDEVLAAMKLPRPRREYQCGSEYTTPSYGCSTCTMSRTCACDGVVRFGYDDRWTEYMNVSAMGGSIDCSADGFGMDPFPKHGKICMCRPRIFTCATEYSKPMTNCTFCSMSTKCHCNGMVTFGVGTSFTPPIYVNDWILCNNDAFARFGDPAVGQGKLCKCAPLNLIAELIEAPMVLIPSPPGRVISRSILAVSLLYLCVYLMLAFERKLGQMTYLVSGPSSIETILESTTSSSVYVAPILCVIFLELGKRADDLTNGSPWLYGMPAFWLQWMIFICAVSFWMQTCSFIGSSYLVVKLREFGADVASATVRDECSYPVFGVYVSLGKMERRTRMTYNVTSTTMYMSFVFVVLGTLSLRERPHALQLYEAVPFPVGDVCTIVLVGACVLVNVILHLFRSCSTADLARGGPGCEFSVEVLKLAATAMNFAPMLSVLFLGTQIAVDWSGASLPATIATWMRISTGALLIQVLLVIVAPYLTEASLQKVGDNGEVDFVTRNTRKLVMFSAVRWLAMAFLYCGVAVIYVRLFFFGGQRTLIHMLFRLGWLYFAVYLALWAFITLREMKGGYNRVIRTLTVAKETVVFCPMLAAFFLAVFVQARHLQNRYGFKGEPQAYCQDFMVIAIIAVAIQLLIVFAMGSGKFSRNGKTNVIGLVMVAIFNIAIGLLYLSVAVVAVSAFILKAVHADGYGSQLA